MRMMLRRLVIIAILGGLALLGVSALVTRSPEGYMAGFPLSMAKPVLPCQAPNPLNGCGFYYDPLTVGLDLLFWVAVTSIVTSILTRALIIRRR